MSPPSGGFHHVAIRSSRFEASVAFYRDVLGFAQVLRWGEGDGRAVMLDAGGGNRVEIFAGGEPAGPAGPLLHFALNCEDVDAVTEKVRAAGCEVTVEPKDVDLPSEPPVRVRISFFRGPDGETIELFRELP